MNILITNDDGYEAEGIKVLAEELSKNHNVYVLAPSSNRSAVSNCVSIREMLELKKINDKLWTLSGFPADCVITAMRSGIFEGIEFDVVLSGINKGPNLGTDIVYSGTCAGARQAVFYKKVCKRSPFTDILGKSAVDKDRIGQHNHSIKENAPQEDFYGYNLYYRPSKSGHGFHCFRHGLCRAEKRVGKTAISGCPPGADQRRNADCAGPLWIPAAAAN
jgi:hypothetical protein